jgi:hypothetical protein
MATYTFQAAQSSLGYLLDSMDAGKITSVDLIKTAGSPVVAKLVKKATYDAADIANSSVTSLVPQLQLQHGPMNPATNGLYKMTKILDNAAAVPDATVHEFLQVTQGAGGVLYTAVASGTNSPAITITYTDPGVLQVGNIVTVVGTAISVSLSNDATPVIDATAATVAASVMAHPAAAALVTAVANGTTSTLAAAFGTAPLTGAAAQPAGAPLFQTYGIYRKRNHSKNALVAPTVTQRAVLISKAHADFLGL